MKAMKQKTRAAGRPSGRTKRYLAAVIALVLALVISTTALADSGKDAGTSGGQPRTGQPGQQPQGSGSQTNTPSGTGDPQSKTGAGQNGDAAGINLDKIEDAIAALTDETVQADLTSLLEAYETALAAKQTAIDEKNTDDLSSLSTAVSAAKEALDAALEEAGVSTDDLYGVPELANDGTGRMENRPALNTTTIAEAIAALDDTDANKATLTTLLEAYEAALEAQSSADTTALTEDEIAALAEAVQTAEQALLEAAKTAGVSTGAEAGRDARYGGNPALNTTTIAEAIAALDDTDANKATLTTLLEAYEAALAAQSSADTSALTEDEIAALAEATQTSELALQEALKNAGISEEPIQEQNERQIQTQTEQGASLDEQFELNVLGDSSTDTDTEPTGILSAFLQWLSNLVK